MSGSAAASGPPARLAVVGAVNLDLSVAVEQLPAPGETVVGPELHRAGGGMGANAVAAARVGAAVTLVGAIGDDDAGRQVRAELEAEGIDCAGLACVLISTEAPVLLTLGGDGAVIAMPSDADTVSLPPTRVEVVDTTGAGDTVNGVFSARLAAADDVIAAARTVVRLVSNRDPPIDPEDR